MIENLQKYGSLYINLDLENVKEAFLLRSPFGDKPRRTYKINQALRPRRCLWVAVLEYAR